MTKEGDTVSTKLPKAAFYSDYAGRPGVYFEPGMTGIVAQAASPSVRYGPNGEDERVIVDFELPLPDGSVSLERVALWKNEVAQPQANLLYDAAKADLRATFHTGYQPLLPCHNQPFPYLLDRALCLALAEQGGVLDYDFACKARNRLRDLLSHASRVAADEAFLYRGCHPERYLLEFVWAGSEEVFAPLHREVERLQAEITVRWPTRQTLVRVVS